MNREDLMELKIASINKSKFVEKIEKYRKYYAPVKELDDFVQHIVVGKNIRKEAVAYLKSCIAQKDVTACLILGALLKVIKTEGTLKEVQRIYKIAESTGNRLAKAKLQKLSACMKSFCGSVVEKASVDRKNVNIDEQRLLRKIEKYRRYHAPAKELDNFIDHFLAEKKFKNGALEYLEKSMNSGDVSSMFILGALCKEMGTKDALQKACQIYEKAVATGNKIAKDKLRKVQGFLRNAPVDQPCHNKVDIDHIRFMPAMTEEYRAIANEACKKGEFKKAFDYFTLCASGGDAEASYEVALCYRDGRGVAGDLLAAIKWLETASFKGFAKASNLLGEIYEDNKNKAMYYFFTAMKQGDSKASERFFYTATTGSYMALTLDQQQTCVDIINDAKYLHIADIPASWEAFFCKHLPRSVVSEIKVDKGGVHIIDHLPETLKMLDLSGNNLSSQDIVKIELKKLPLLESLKT